MARDENKGRTNQHNREEQQMIKLTYTELLASYHERSLITAKEKDQGRDNRSYNRVACIVAVGKLRDELTAKHGANIPMEALLAMREHMAKY